MSKFLTDTLIANISNNILAYFSASENSVSFSLFIEKNTYFYYGQGVDLPPPRLWTSPQLIFFFVAFPKNL